MTESVWNGYRRVDFEFEGKNAIVVFTEKPVSGNKWILKTEYFEAFQSFEMKMLAEGYALAHVDNTTRWCLDSDTERQAAFCAYLAKTYGFCEKCLPVGMSCGGMQAVFLGANHPECVAAMVLDAPVINFLSCPFFVGRENKYKMSEEFTEARNMTLSDLLSFRNNPLDRLCDIIGIPVYLCCGDSDVTVFYEENGKLLSEYFTKNGGNITEVLVPGRDHHPHLPEEYNERAAQFVRKYY